MPDLALAPHDYHYPRKPGGTKPQAGRVLVRSIAHEFNTNNRYCLVVGVYNKADINLLGEVVYISRGERSQDINFHAATLDSMVRGRHDIRLALGERHAALVELREQVESLRSMLHEDWSVWREDEGLVEFLYYLFGAHLARLDRARTSARTSALPMLIGALRIRDSRGRDNPMSSVARLVGVQNRLRYQTLQDRTSADSLSRRERIALDGLENDIEATLAIDELMQFARPSVIERQLPRYLNSLLAKPFIYPALYTKWLLSHHDLSADMRIKIAAAFAAERGLLDLNYALSVARQHFSTFAPSDIDSLLEELGDMSFDPSYQALADLIISYLLVMRRAVSESARNSKMFTEVIASIKHLIRYRLTIDSTGPWSIPVTRNRANPAIWTIYPAT